jgi:hypothetical protein
MTTSALQFFQTTKNAGNYLSWDAPFPLYEDLDITNYHLVAGVYTLGIIQRHRTDIEIIHPEIWESYTNYTWLDNAINLALKNNKTVCLVIWDEDVALTPEFARCLLKYQECPVYLITQLDEYCTLDYRDCGIKNIIELPWWLLNDSLCYYRLCNRNNIIAKFDARYNFLCMINRHEPHKINLINSLGRNELNEYGYITASNYKKLSKETQKFCYPSSNGPYPILNHVLGKTRANSVIGGINVSANVENFLKLEKQYQNVPLIINPESSCGVFFSTEKSLWPLLIGRLCLLSGRWNLMNYIQRFYDVDFSSYIDLSFDHMPGFTVEDHQNRIECMISSNKNLIKNSKEIYQMFGPAIESARWTIGKNLYKFFVQQLEGIPKL